MLSGLAPSALALALVAGVLLDLLLGEARRWHPLVGFGRPGLVVLRSIGKFFGLAGLRLGFVGAHAPLLAALDDLLGPWTVSGPARGIRVGLPGSDTAWARIEQALREWKDT